MTDPITPREAMALLGVSKVTLRTYARQGRLTAYRLPGGHRRYSRAEVLALPKRDLPRVARPPLSPADAEHMMAVDAGLRELGLID